MQNDCIMCDYKNNFDIIWENNEVIIAFDNFGIDYSHVLLIPKKHQLCFQGQIDRIDKIVRKIINLFKFFFSSDVIVYEHGNTQENVSGNASIDHAHIHFVRSNNRDLQSVFTNTYEYDFNSFYGSIPTLPYHMISINGELANVTFDKFESQYFRKIYSENHLWDWRNDGIEIDLKNQHYDMQKEGFRRFLKEELDK